MPLIEVEDSLRIIDIVTPMELHILLGIFNHIYDELYKVWNKVEQWAKKLNFERAKYYGGTFSGNQCRNMLRRIDILESLGLPPQYYDFLRTLSALDTVCHSLFGKKLAPSFESDVDGFISAYSCLNIPVTLKVHVLQAHVVPFCKEKKSRSLHVFLSNALSQCTITS